MLLTYHNVEKKRPQRPFLPSQEQCSDWRRVDSVYPAAPRRSIQKKAWNKRSLPWFPCLCVVQWSLWRYSNQRWPWSIHFWRVSSPIDRLCTPISGTFRIWIFPPINYLVWLVSPMILELRFTDNKGLVHDFALSFLWFWCHETKKDLRSRSRENERKASLLAKGHERAKASAEHHNIAVRQEGAETMNEVTWHSDIRRIFPKKHYLF